MMVIGFTGTRDGMTDAQWDKVAELLDGVREDDVVEHGGCDGADLQFDTICQLHLYEQPHTIIRPGPYTGLSDELCLRMGTEVKGRMPYLKRNQAIVDDADRMIACPSSAEEQFRSLGTWATIRYARKTKTSLTIVWPDGSTTSTD